MRMRKSFPTMTRKGQKASEEPSEKMLELGCNVGGRVGKQVANHFLFVLLGVTLPLRETDC